MQLVSETRPQVKRDRLLGIAEVETATSFKKSTIYALMKRNAFPSCVHITKRRVAWPESSILQWVQDRIAEAQSRQLPLPGSGANPRQTATRGAI